MKSLKNILPWVMAFVIAAACAWAESGLAVGQKLEDDIGVTAQAGEHKINIRIVSNNLRVYFIGEDNKIVPPAWPEAQVRLDGISRKEIENELITLNSNGTYLGSPRVIRAPFNYFVTLLALYEDPEQDNQSASPSTPDNLKKLEDPKFVGRYRLLQYELPKDGDEAGDD